MEIQGHDSYFSIFIQFLSFPKCKLQVNIKIIVGVSSGTSEARMLKLCMQMDNELLYCGIEDWEFNSLLLIVSLVFHFSVF